MSLNVAGRDASQFQVDDLTGSDWSTAAVGKADWAQVKDSIMATAEEKRTITKKRLQELRNLCREHYNVLIEEGTMPDAADVRVTNQKLEELMELLDGKIKWDNA